MTRLTRSLSSSACLLLLPLMFIAGCHRDPNVKKQKFMAQGNQDFDKGKYSEAAISYGRALQVDPRFADAHFKLAQSYLKQGSWAAGYQELNRTVTLQPENWEAQMDIARILLAGGKFQEAKDRALLVLKSNPGNADAQIVLSQTNSQLGNPADALQQAKDAVTAQPDKGTTYLNLAMIQKKNGALADAEANLQKANSLDTTSIGPLTMLGHFYERRKRFPEAEKQFQAAIEREPKSPGPRGDLA